MTTESPPPKPFGWDNAAFNLTYSEAKAIVDNPACYANATVEVAKEWLDYYDYLRTNDPAGT